MTTLEYEMQCFSIITLMTTQTNDVQNLKESIRPIFSNRVFWYYIFFQILVGRSPQKIPRCTHFSFRKLNH